jgi:hypothetical protein
MKEDHIIKFEFELELANPPPLTEKQTTELEALNKVPDSEIDYSDIPETPMYRPAQKRLQFVLMLIF